MQEVEQRREQLPRDAQERTMTLRQRLVPPKPEELFSMLARESSLGGVKQKKPPAIAGGFFCLMPGSDLLSHGKTRTTIGDVPFHC